MCEQLTHEHVLYAGMLKEYIALRSSIIKQNPINKKVITIPLATLGHDLKSLSMQSEKDVRCSLELSGFCSVCANIRDYVIKILELEYVERSKEKVSDPQWVEDEKGRSQKEQVGLKAIIQIHVCDQKSRDLVQSWNNQDIKIKGCKIKARIL